MSDSATIPGGLRDRKRAATRTAISDTARQLTADHGFNGWTVEQLCERVGVSRRTFFNYFPSKEDALIGHRDDDIPAELAEVFVASTGSLLDALADLMTSMAARIELSPKQFEQLAAAITSEPGLLLKLIGTGQAWERSIAELIAVREGFAVDDPRATGSAMLFNAISHRANERYLRNPEHTTYREVLTGYIDAARFLFTT